MPVDYVTAYEISQRAPDWPFACVGFIPLIAGAVIIWGKRRFKWAQPHWLFAVFCLLFGLLWVSVVGFSTIHADSAAYNAYRDGEYQTVEGIVSDFHPMPYEGHQDECFSVADQRFCYSDYEIAPGFHNATSHGGPIRAGLPVRISYRDGRILKLEVPRGDVPTPAQSATIESQGQRQWQQRAENDPIEQEVTTAALFTAACWTLWWNVKWKQTMRFWVKPPYRPWVELAFRIFFALDFLGAVVALIRQFHLHPLSQGHILTTIKIASIMCVVVALMSAFTLWMAQRRDTKNRSS
ncbi:hypothetical protein [Edaphobacter dinghuensis]|uniref:Uncharacterized protein n=1 Tax=Edaphobacter dinghuensis TaxID=1560005 RepID=A0A917M022_9BACT|nr:hypothetical protein [Edaphobacter dinghuensis]GGG67716.1 hypothetical protein GCM10011585_07060 [Edaphobacter dinghuensis]